MQMLEVHLRIYYKAAVHPSYIHDPSSIHEVPSKPHAFDETKDTLTVPHPGT